MICYQISSVYLSQNNRLILMQRTPDNIFFSQKTANVVPICLPWGEKISEKVEGKAATLVGWGATEYGES